MVFGVKIFLEIAAGAFLFLLWKYGVVSNFGLASVRWGPPGLIAGGILFNSALPAIANVALREIRFLQRQDFNVYVISIFFGALIVAHGVYLGATIRGRERMLSQLYVVLGITAAVLSVAAFIILHRVYGHETIGRIASLAIIAVNVLLFLFLRLATL
ncbi:MAG: hypothetical protein FWG66_06830 [Spirochaetes bacterium]|nr:hypothetical protein [Spirochaetota bacterium]